MLDPKRLDYYIEREADERRRAVAAVHPITVAIHTQLADCYARIIRSHHERAAGQPGADGEPIAQ